MTNLDDHGQPISDKFNRQKNSIKVLSSLQGILEGITADDCLRDIEVQFLHAWLEEQEDKRGDILDVYDAVSSALEDKIITTEEKEDILQVIKDCLEYGEMCETTESKVNRFLGFLKGIISDGTINSTELNTLTEKLYSDIELQNAFPTRILYNLIRAAKADNHIDDKELIQIISCVTDLAGGCFAKDRNISGSPLIPFNDKITSSCIQQQACFTGKFISGTRSEIENQAREIGLIPHASVTKVTRLLVIGSLSSRDWIFSNAGRKIEKAAIYRSEGNQITIASEEEWKFFLERNIK